MVTCIYGLDWSIYKNVCEQAGERSIKCRQLSKSKHLFRLAKLQEDLWCERVTHRPSNDEQAFFFPLDPFYDLVRALRDRVSVRSWPGNAVEFERWRDPSKCTSGFADTMVNSDMCVACMDSFVEAIVC